MKEVARKDTKCNWNQDLEDEFDKVKGIVSSVKVLRPNEPDLSLHLYSDASRVGGLGYVLVQPGPGGVTQFVQCGSNSLSRAQVNY